MNIKKVLKERGYTFDRLASEWSSVNGKTITKGALSQSIGNNPTVERLQEIANVVGCKVSDFFADEDIQGFIKINGNIHEVKSFEDLRELLTLEDK